MFWKKSSFSDKKIWDVDLNHLNKKKSWSWFSWIIRFLFIIICIFLVFWIWKYVIWWTQASLWIISKSSARFISSNIWQEMKKDEFWNINILFIWYGWKSHAWWYLADSIMVASWNPELWAITFISIPRDLLVSNPVTKWVSRVNALFTQMYHKRGDLLSWSAWFSEKISEILWLQINYYATIDFGGFEKIIDTLWWIDINVKNMIHDTTYPDWEIWYMTFHLDSWPQHLDWKTALMYARSRHTTSDFDRSLRQQQIIDALKDKLLSWWYLKNVSKVKALYSDYTKMVTTNISFKEIIWAIKYTDSLNNIFSFGLNTECVYSNFEYMKPWCFLWVPNRDLFDWASVMIPEWTSSSNISFYDNIHKFAFLAMHNQEYLIERANIIIQNWIDKNFARSLWKQLDWHWNLLAAKLKKYWFKISDTQNATSPIEKTTVFIPSTWSFAGTTKILWLFFNSQIQVESVITTWNNVVIILWNDYIQNIKDNWFKYDL
jgi:LCP family protein required for cell wall assembly